MKYLRFAMFDLRLAAFFLCAAVVPCALTAAPKKIISPIISTADGKLSYDADARGNRVPDFSTCGYAAGDKEIPNAPIKIVVTPIAGDETERIQRALDYVGSLPADTNGLRGAVFLTAGRHEVSGGLLITNSGVVLRGAGISNTVLFAAGLDRRTLIRVAGRKDFSAGNTVQITDDYIPVGATSFHVADAAGLAAGSSVRIVRPSTQAWIDLLGANDFGGGEGGGWKPGQYDIAWNRTIKSIQGNAITVNGPITTAMDTNVCIGRVETFSWPGRVSNVGIENIRLESSFDQSNPKDENHSWFGITMENVVDAWVRQVTFKHFAGSAVALYESCQQVTVEDCASLAPVSENGGGRRNTFFTMGQQTLFLRCYAEHGRHDFSVGDCAAGPNAFVQCEASEALSDSGAIESWSSGTLFDLARVDGNAISLGYRPGNNEGIGWAAANSVLWNCSASIIRCWNPSGAKNYSFGSWAGFEGDGVWRNSNGFMRPESLYAAQLAERNGRRTQIMSRASKESTNPNLDEAADLIAKSRQPAPLLLDYIAAAGTRNPISTEPGDAKRIEDVVETQHAKPSPRRQIFITNGWIVCDGKLLIGGGVDTVWWRGSIRPVESSGFGPALTRFAPGRVGVGLTDDLDDLAETMANRGQVTFDHHYGLWYDIRRDDHERVRRMTGDVIPPFFEQPFARSVQGTGWDGLSKYDLTKFNPWYWSRLKNFADLGEKHGLVLFNQNYFQHNIIEAGAHWVDCPWRTANNINGTGFPEPPPFAGDKRIFMAEQFYDETDPVRRKLHEGFIRQNLNNFTNNANVIQFTSAEFTGPLHFMQFWIDTVAAWEKESGHHALVALSATKDVQDAILADAQRSATVDVIDFRYWWQANEGLYNPKGGQNLSPRQHDRLWIAEKRSVGKPTESNLAQMTAEYRAKFPGKAVINNVGRGEWAYVCAGGSIPKLPMGTDEKLLAAIPLMKPWMADEKRKIWALGEKNKQMLVFSANGAELDDAGGSGKYRLCRVDLHTGQVTRSEQIVQGGGKLVLPGGVVWLVKE